MFQIKKNNHIRFYECYKLISMFKYSFLCLYVYIDMFKYQRAHYFKGCYIWLNQAVKPKPTPGLLSVSVQGLLRPSRPMANTEQTQKKHRKQTLILLADIKLLQKMTAFLYMCIRNIQGLGLQVVRKKTGLLHSLVRKAHPKS